MNQNPIDGLSNRLKVTNIGRRLFFLMMFVIIIMNVQVFAQNQISVTGNVADIKGETLPGVNVFVKGTTNGTITDIDGNFTLSVQASDVLVVSFVGYKTQEIAVEGQSSFKINLEEDVTDLDEVVVVGYGVQKKALITGANQNLKGDDIVEMNTSTAMEALQGIAPGVSITRADGQPGSSTQVTIRGLGTIGNSKPLYVVDGVVTSSIDYLNPTDIASIDVLKDAASAAIYGSRAANGVVLVTTVKGKQGKPKVTYEGYYGVQNMYRKPSALNAQEYMYIMDEGRMNDGLNPRDWESILKNNSWLSDNYGGDLGTVYGQEIWANLQNGWTGTDWVKEMTQENAPIQSHALTITGGSEDVKYSLGASYFNQKGIVGGDQIDAGFERLTLRLNSEYNLFKNADRTIVKLGQNLTYTNTENRSVRTGDIYWNDLHNAIVQNPLMPAYWDKSPDKHGFSPNLDGLNNNQVNPIASMYYNQNYNWSKDNKVMGNVFVEVEPMKDLKFRSSYGIDAWFGHYRAWDPTYGLGLMFQANNDAAQQQMWLGNNWTLTNTISYDRLIGDHRFSVLLGNEYYKNSLNNSIDGRISNTRFNDPKYAYLSNADIVNIDGVSLSGEDWAAGGGGLMSYMGRFQYNYKEKYMMSATIRHDGSSNFADGKRWGTFPSFSAGWIVSEERFMQSFTEVVDFVKLRASWGQNGNQAIDNFVYTSTMAYRNPGYFLGDNKPASSSTAIPARVPNPDVTWETSEQLNVGFDTRFFSSRLGFTLDWYQKVTKDWLVIAPIQGTAGAAAPWINGGDIENTGIELMLSWNDKVGEFKYGLTVSGAHNKNEVTRIANADGIIHGPTNVLSQGTGEVSRCEVGKPIGFFYGYQTDGIIQNQQGADEWVAPEGAANAGEKYFADQRPGDVRFVDQNSDGVIDEKDKVMLGDPNPDFELGVQLSAEYKGFYANMTLTGKFGMQVMRSYRSFADQFDQNYTTEVFQRWHGEGTSNRLPRLSSTSHRNTNYISDIYVHDADYLRINNLTLGYKFDRMLKGVSWISNLKLYTTIRNLHTFTEYEGMDPEVGYGHDASWASGIDLGLYPQARTVLFGISATF